VSRVSELQFQERMAQSILRRAALLTVTGGLALRWNSGAQQPSVNLFAVVRDSQGGIAADLRREDFEVVDQGKKQTLSGFVKAGDLPLTIGLLLDTSCSQRHVEDQQKKATQRFIRSYIREDKDQAFLVQFDARTEVLQDVTSSRARLDQALERIHLPQCDPDRVIELQKDTIFGPRLIVKRLYEAVYTTADQIMKKRAGRKVLILVSGGADRGSRATLAEAIEQVLRADTMVYSIYFDAFYSLDGDVGFEDEYAGQPSTSANVNGKEVLQRISRETGAGFFAVSKQMSAEQIYDRIAEELQGQYSLSFVPTKADRRGFHKIRLDVNRKNLVVQTREGYYQSR
jgi:VWFA-related protein